MLADPIQQSQFIRDLQKAHSDEVRSLNKKFSQEIRSLKKQLEAQQKREQKLEKNRTIDPKYLLTELSKYIPPLALELVQHKLMSSMGHGHLNFSAAYKEWVHSIQQMSPRTFDKLKEIFVLPSLRHLRNTSRNVKLREYMSGSNSDTLLLEKHIDYSQFEKVKETELLEGVNQESADMSGQNSAVPVDSQQLADKLGFLFEETK